MQKTDTHSLVDYGNDEQLPDYAEFSHKYEFFKMFRTCLSLQFNGQYARARKTFYDSMSLFAPVFDKIYVERCNSIIKKYDTKEYHNLYT